MDWYSWLSKSGLEPSLAYDYSLLFTHNELEQEDVPHFNHEFLQSMGISIAKHRLLILKLAKKTSTPRHLSRLLSAVNKTKKVLARYLNTLVVRRDCRSAIVVVTKPDGGGQRWKGAMLKRNRRVVVVKQGRLLITDGGVRIRKASNGMVSHGTSPLVAGGGAGGAEMRWDSMFQDMKPT